MGKRRAGKGDEKKEGEEEGWEQGGRGRRIRRSAGWRDGMKEGVVREWEEGWQDKGTGRSAGRWVGRKKIYKQFFNH